MKSADANAIRRYRIPSLTLMERAGKGASAIVEGLLPREDAPVVILCGKGNNGGDGFVIARHLSGRGYDVTVALLESPSLLSGDAETNFQRMEEGETLAIMPVKELLRSRRRFACIIDAMLGTSSRGSLTGMYKKAVQWSNRQPAMKLAVDIPTGLNGESGEVRGEAFKADVTITFANPKSGFYHGRAKEFTGAVRVVDIGIPAGALPVTNIFAVGPEDVRRTLPVRPVNSHKHSVGKVFILAGSRGMAGAALLSSMAAMRSGAGQVILGIPETEYPIVARRTLEVMPLPLPATAGGTLSLLALPEIRKRIAWADVVVIGPGLSLNDETQHCIRDVIRSCRTPLIIDADALTAVAGDLSALTAVKRRETILTPHHGEFSRISGLSTISIADDPFTAAVQFAKQHHVTLVLKGAPSMTATADGSLYINTTGNPGMSTAGSGDVLSGIIAAMVGQGCRRPFAAVNGVCIHGAAGDAAAHRRGIRGMIARDIMEQIPFILRQITI